MTNLDSILKSRDITLPMKVRLVKVMVFPVMWELDYKKMLITQELILLYCGVGKTCESPLDYKQIQSAHPKGNQSWIFIGRTDVKLKLILWPLDAKNCLIWKDPYAGKDWRWEEKGTTGDEMVGRHLWLNRHGFDHALGVGDGQGSMACCSPWGCKESDMTEQLNWTEPNRSTSSAIMPSKKKASCRAKARVVLPHMQFQLRKWSSEKCAPDSYCGYWF